MLCVALTLISSGLYKQCVNFFSNLGTIFISDLLIPFVLVFLEIRLQNSYNYMQIISLVCTAFWNDKLKCLIIFRHNIMLIILNRFLGKTYEYRLLIKINVMFKNGLH